MGGSDYFQSEKEGAGTDEDEEDSDQAHHGFCGQDLTELCGEGSGDHASQDQAGYDGKIFQFKKKEESQGLRESDKKFGHIHRADDVAGGMAFCQEGGGYHGAPPASSDGVEESSGQGEGNGVGGFGVYGDRLVVRAPKDIAAHQDQVGADPGFKFCSVEIGEEISTGDSSDHPRDRKLEAESSIDVFMKDMADTAGAGGEDFRNFDAVANHRWGNAECEEEGRAGDSVCHAEGAVDDLAGETD